MVSLITNKLQKLGSCLLEVFYARLKDGNEVYKYKLSGIREEDLPNIFKRFYKVKTSKKNDSIGIGLALSKAIIEEHNGGIL